MNAAVNSPYFGVAAVYLCGQLSAQIGSLLRGVLTCAMYLIGFRIYTIKNSDTVSTFLNQYKYYAMEIGYGHCEYPHGYMIGKYFVGRCDTESLNGQMEKIVLTLCCTMKFYNELRKYSKRAVSNEAISANSADNIQSGKQKTVRIIEKTGASYGNCYYQASKMSPIVSTAKEPQTVIINDIIKQYEEKGVVNAFIYGASGAGKSTVASLLAQKMKGYLCSGYRPNEPGDMLNALITHFRFASNKYRTTAGKKCGPLIVLIDEIDVIIHNIHTARTPHAKLRTEIYNKPTFNAFMDRINEYRGYIYIFTSNVSKETIDEIYDPCYLRPGRISAYYELHDDKPKQE